MVQFMICGRAGGKTTETVRWLKEDPDHRVILTASEVQAKELRDHHQLSARQVISATSVQQLRGRANLQVAVEDLDLIPPRLLSLGGTAALERVTATGELI